MKVYLQYKYGSKDSPQFQYLIKHKSSEVDYLNVTRGNDVVTKSNVLKKQNSTKGNIRSFIMKHDLPIPNVSFVLSKYDCDLVHAINTIPITTKPFIVELEMFWQPFLCGVDNKLAQKIVKFLLKQKNCKSIAVWSALTKKNLLTLCNDDKEIAKKIHVIYPAVPLQKRNSPHKTLTMGFIGRYFEEKGGDVALEVMRKCPQLRGIAVSTVPDSVRAPRNVEVLPLVSREKLLSEVYPKIDVLVYPGFSDSFGFAFLEAMSFGIPIVTVNGYSRSELVEPNVNGLVINSILDKWGQYSGSNRNMFFVDRLVSAVATLDSDRKLLKTFGDNNYRCVESGKFAIDTRNKQLLKLYKEAIKV